MSNNDRNYDLQLVVFALKKRDVERDDNITDHFSPIQNLVSRKGQNCEPASL